MLSFSDLFPVGNTSFVQTHSALDKAVDKLVKKELKYWSIVNPSTNKRTEWMRNITPDKALDITIRTIKNSGFRYTLSASAIIQSNVTVDNIATESTNKKSERFSFIKFFNKQREELTMPGRRSPILAFFLTIFFGPFGAIYGSHLWGLLLTTFMITSLIYVSEIHIPFVISILWITAIYLGTRGAIKNNNNIRKALTEKF